MTTAGAVSLVCLLVTGALATWAVFSRHYDDSLLQALADPREAAAYLDAVIELENAGALTLALRQVAQAQGLKIGEQPLLDVLNDTEELTIDALNRALHALGLRLSFKPAPEASQKSS